MPRKKRIDVFRVTAWHPVAGNLETNAVEWLKGDERYYLYPIYVCGRGRLNMTRYFLDIRPGIRDVDRVIIYHRPGNAWLIRLSLNLPDTVENFAEGVKMASTTLLGKLQLATINCFNDNVVYIVASRLPEPPMGSRVFRASALPVPA